jgi:hypothetical protein
MTVYAGSSPIFPQGSTTVSEQIQPAPVQLSVSVMPPTQSREYQSVSRQSLHSMYLDHGLVLDLIEDTSLVDGDVLDEVLKTAELTESSLIDVLLDGGFIALSDRRDIKAAYDAVSQGFLYQPWAKQALTSAISQFIPFEEMLLVMGLHPTNAFSESFLAELTLSTHLITISQMERARLLCLSRGLTLGQSLVQLGLINIATYKLLLDLAARYRSGHLTQAQLKEMVSNSFAGFNSSGQWLKLAQSVRGFGVYCSNVELLDVLDLLVESELVSEVTILGVMESALERSTSFEQVAGQCSMIEPALMLLAQKMAKRVRAGETTSANACQILNDRCRLLQGQVS